MSLSTVPRAADSAAQLRERADLAASLLEGAGNVYHLAGLLASAAYEALVYGEDRRASEYIRRAIPITRELDNPHMWMLLSGNAGLTALLPRDGQAVVFQTPIMIGVLIVGTGFVLWRILRRPHA